MAKGDQLFVTGELFVTKICPILGTKVTNDVNDEYLPENDFVYSNECLMINNKSRPKRGFVCFIRLDTVSHFSRIIGHLRHLVPKQANYSSLLPDYSSLIGHFTRLLVTEISP